MLLKSLKIIVAKFPLRVVLIVPFVLQIFLTVGLVGYLSFRNGQKAVNELADKLNYEASSRVVQHLDSYLEEPVEITKVNLDAIALGLIDIQDFDESGRYFWKQMQRYSLYGLGFFLETGKSINAGRFPINNDVGIEEIIIQDENIAQTYTYATDDQGNRTELIFSQASDMGFYEDLIEKVISTSQPIWTPIHALEEYPQFPATLLISPFYDHKDQLLGYFTVAVSLTGITEFINTLEITPNAKTFIVERDGMLVASSTSNNPFIVVNGKAKHIAAIDSQEPITQGIAQYLQAKFGNFSNIQNSQQINL